MKMNKFAAIFCAALFLSYSAFAQNEEESTVEGEYMSSMDDVVVAELANADDLDSKLTAINILHDAADNGTISPEMMVSLEKLAGEGVNTQSRTKGRVMNNFPEIRREACLILGKVGTDEAAQTLNKIVGSEAYTGETMVLNAAIKSLGDIGYNENDTVTNSVSFYTSRYLVLNPQGSSSLAITVVDALEKLVDNTKDKKPVINCLQKIYSTPTINNSVRNRAKEVLKKLGADTSDSKSKKKSSSK